MYDPQTRKFNNYDVSDGLQDNEFNRKAYYKSRDGKIYFGGIKGYNIISPDAIQPNTNIPKIAWTSFSKANQEVKLDKAILESKSVTLSYMDRGISFDFAAFNYYQSHKNQYAYQLAPLDTGWTYLGNQHRINFTNLNPGNYRLKVKASNNDGIWNEDGIAIFIQVTPPWYQTWWATTIWWVLGIGLPVLFYFQRVRSLQKRQAQLEKQVRERTREIEQQKEEISVQAEELRSTNDRLVELDAFKESMTGMIAHDLKNPLGNILWLTKDQPKVNQLAHQMLNLILNLLDVQKLRRAEVKLTLQEVSVAETVEEVIEQVQLLADSKHQLLMVEIEQDYIVSADGEMLKRVLVNLLTNAIKYTPEGGKIMLSASEQEGQVKMSVKDNGVGIAPDMHELVFDQYRQIQAKASAKIQSTGLGLTFCKMAIEAMGSQIHLESDRGQGATFSFDLKLIRTESKKVLPQTNGQDTLEDQLNPEDKAQIIPLLPRLRELEVYDALEVEAALEMIKNGDSPSLSKWASALIDAAYRGDSTFYEQALEGLVVK
jgi:signal transduction histidine kinase